MKRRSLQCHSKRRLSAVQIVGLVACITVMFNLLSAMIVIDNSEQLSVSLVASASKERRTDNKGDASVSITYEELVLDSH